MGSVRKKISISELVKVPAEKPKALLGCRHVQVFLMTLGFFCGYAIRVSTSITLEAMTNSTIANPNFKEFAWDNSIKDMILSSFFWGYVCTQIPGSLIAQKWGARKLLSYASGLCGIMTLVVPPAAYYGDWQAVCAARMIIGLCQGILLPSLHLLLSKWVPSEERGRLSSFVYSGGWIGNVISLLSSGMLSASAGGWPSSFYVWGSINIFIAICIFFFIKESPAEHPYISPIERQYIEVSLGTTETNEKLSTPWIPIIFSVPVWALLVTQCAQSWGFWMLLTKTPSYLNSALGYNIEQNGEISSLPYLSAWILNFPISYISDLCIKRNIISTQTSRKICNTIGQWIPAAALIGLGYVNKDWPELAIAILIIAVSTNVATYCGYNVNHIDLSPNFAGILMGITNTVANICGILAPLVATFVIKDPTNILQWRNIFFMSAGIYIIGNLIFILFGSSKIQRWNDPVNWSKNSTTYRIPEVKSSA